MYAGGLGVAEELRALSYKFNVPVVTAVQANSEGMNNEDIGMEHIAESRGIAHTADWISALYQTDSDRENGIIKMRILKNRLGGRVGKTLDFKLNPDTLILDDVTIDGESTYDTFNIDEQTSNSDDSLSATLDNSKILEIL
jgi:hypothetical protein